MYLANFMNDAGVKQDTLRRRCLASVNMGGNPDIPDSL
jgi:hypothetical protein